MHEFRKVLFESASAEQRLRLCDALAAYLSTRLTEGDFHESIYALIAELKAVGHDLWSQDEDDDFQVWGPNYEEPADGAGIVITFTRPDSVVVELVKT